MKPEPIVQIDAGDVLKPIVNPDAKVLRRREYRKKYYQKNSKKWKQYYAHRAKHFNRYQTDPEFREASKEYSKNYFQEHKEEIYAKRRKFNKEQSTKAKIAKQEAIIKEAQANIAVLKSETPVEK